MEFTIKSSSFRLVAMILGAVGLAATVVGYAVFWVAVGLGISFGIGGFLFDYFTGSRYANGQLTAWALAIGAGIVAFYWSRQFVVDGQSQISAWPLVFQYVAVVLMSWAILMFILPTRHNEP